MNGALYNATAWNAGCSSGTGICGTASDAQGVATVRVTVQDVSTLEYWNGVAFASTIPVKLLASGTTSWRLRLPVPPDDRYNVSVETADTLGNVTLAQLAQFSIDTVGPAAPAFSLEPPAQTSETTAEFAFSDSDPNPGLTFHCSLDGAAPSTCSSPMQFADLALGAHEMQVVAFDVAHNPSAPAAYDWTIVDRVPFTISGSVDGSFAPGVAQPVNVTLTNPNDFPITVASVAIVVDDATTKDGQTNAACVGSDNLAMTRGFTGPVTLPANSTATLEQLGVSPAQWPEVTMPDLPTNQDACKETTFALTYSGAASYG